MRLFDHLASGRPIVAITGCWQVRQFENVVDVCETADAFVSGVAEHSSGHGDEAYSSRIELARKQTWACLARDTFDALILYGILRTV
jgi:hypothetical protein